MSYKEREGLEVATRLKSLVATDVIQTAWLT